MSWNLKMTALLVGAIIGLGIFLVAAAREKKIEEPRRAEVPPKEKNQPRPQQEGGLFIPAIRVVFVGFMGSTRDASKVAAEATAEALKEKK